MTVSRKIVVHSVRGFSPEFAACVADWIKSGVVFLGIVGKDAVRLEDLADEVAVGDGTTTPYFLLTTSHPGESLADAVAFADALTGEHAGPVQVVEF